MSDHSTGLGKLIAIAIGVGVALFAAGVVAGAWMF